jgi:beta-galactosidase/beta-glucuronidase
VSPSSQSTDAETRSQAASFALSQPWQMVPSSDDIRRDVIDASDSISWHEAVVPGEWRFEENPADHSSTVMFRTTFVNPPVDDHHRLFVQSDGIFQQADLWLDGAYLGDQDDYFLRHYHDITQLVQLDTQHELLIEVNGGRHAGIWQPISLKRTGPALIRSARVLCRDANDASAHLLLTAHIDTNSSCVGTIRTMVDGKILSSRPQSFSRGSNVVSWTIDIDSPKLWWPWSLGEQNFVDIDIEVNVDGSVSDRHHCRTGLREISMNNWVLTVNGERIYAKGAYVRQPDIDLGRVDPSTLIHDVSLAKDAGLDLLRIRRHIAHPAIYDAADELGMLLWQDMPERPKGKRGRRVAARWTHGMVDTLGQHPSIALWHHRMLDRFTHRHLSRTDPTRSVVGHLSTAIPNKWNAHPRLSSLYDSLGGIGEEFVAATAVAPNLARFVTHEETDLVHSHHEISQPNHVRLMIEHLRRTKYLPTGGFCFVGLADSSVLSDDGILSVDRQPKPTYFAVVDACRPLIVVADALPPTVSPGDSVEIDVHVVSDLRHDITNARVAAVITWPSGEIRREWMGDIAADSCARVGIIRLEVPVTVGTLEILLSVQSGEHVSSNNYSTTVIA